MKIYNVHERYLDLLPEKAGALINGLSGQDDGLWPGDRWPKMKLDSPLGEGASGGHGPVRYTVSEYTPGRRVVFQFDGTGLTEGLDGRHFFEVVSRRKYLVFRHVVDAGCDLKNWLKWHLLIRPMHDALIEDALDRAERELNGSVSRPARWGIWVRFLRWLVSRKARSKEG